MTTIKENELLSHTSWVSLKFLTKFNIYFLNFLPKTINNNFTYQTRQDFYMYCEQRERNGTTILECFGRFDEADANQFVQTLEQLQSQGIRHIILNLAPVYYLDPKVINLLLFGQQFLQALAGTLSLVSPLSSVRNELIRGKIHDTIPTFESLYDAMHRPHSAYAECSG
jgi:anti-anti-sigma factor